jgi:hypothetical protein
MRIQMRKPLARSGYEVLGRRVQVEGNLRRYIYSALDITNSRIENHEADGDMDGMRGWWFVTTYIDRPPIDFPREAPFINPTPFAFPPSSKLNGPFPCWYNAQRERRPLGFSGSERR